MNYRSSIFLYHFWLNFYHSRWFGISLWTFHWLTLRMWLRARLWNYTCFVRLTLRILWLTWWNLIIHVLLVILKIWININENLCIFNVLCNSFCLFIHILARLNKYLLQSIDNLFIECLLIFYRDMSLDFFLESTDFL